MNNGACMTEIHESISRKIKSIRKEKGLTLEDVADICGVSKSMLGEIERGGTNPTILVLWKIAEGLKMPLTALLTEEKPDFTLVQAADLQPINNDTGYKIFSIFPYMDGNRSEVFKIEMAARGKLSNIGHRLELDETIIVLDGEINLVLNGEKILLESGDSIRFKGELSHEIINTGDEIVHLIDILNY